MRFELGPALLFCPADRPDRYAKAAARADAVILDLEDAVAPADKERARAALGATPLDPARTVVRVGAASSGQREADLAAVRRSGYRLVMQAKCDEPDDLQALDGFDVVALVETARGVLAAPALAAHPGVVALMWGAEDLVASTGGTSSRHADGSYRDPARYARAQVLLAAAAHGIAAIDAVHLDLGDTGGLAAEAADAAASGFTATACLHPDQVAVVREAYRPTAERAAWARRVLAAAAEQPGVFRLDGEMVDEPVLVQARALLRRV